MTAQRGGCRSNSTSKRFTLIAGSINVRVTDMKTVTLSSAYESPLREEQKEATRQRILNAAGKLMEDRGLQQFSYAALAEQAGVTERTVYRHFPSKDALLQGLWEWYAQRTRFGAIPQTERDLLAQPLRTFPAFEKDEELCRALWLSPQGRDFRLSNVEERCGFSREGPLKYSSSGNSAYGSSSRNMRPSRCSIRYTA